MDELKFTALEIFSAYKKLKHYFYYDNTSLFIRQRIADFEKEIESKQTESKSYEQAFWERMEDLAYRLNIRGPEYWLEQFKNNIGYRITPKSFDNKKPTILTNRTHVKNLMLHRVNIFIDASIEIHIISVLWLMHVGRHFSKWIDKDNYAYQLELTGDDEEEKVVNGLRLYKPYFLQYQTWRDKAIKKAEELLKDEKDVVILSLDIRDYFSSVRLNLQGVENILYKEKPSLRSNPKVRILFEFLGLINRCYTEKIRIVKQLPKSIAEQLSEFSEYETILPIGLLSSGLLGNICLRDFDKEIKDKLNPSFYGRYVDDLMFVLKNVEVKHDTISPVNFFISTYFINRGLLDFKDVKEIDAQFIKEDIRFKSNKPDYNVYEYTEPEFDEDENAIDYEIKKKQADTIKFIIARHPSLEIQSSKIILQDLDYKESPAIINNFKKNLEKNRSEFRFLPDEDEVENEFDEEAFSLHYNDSMNKLRSIKEFSEDKYGASKYLASKIFATNLSKETADVKTTVQILTFFKGIVNLSFHILWEKVATYFIINKLPEALSRFYWQSFKAIQNVSYDKYEHKDYQHSVGSQFKNDMIEYLYIAIATPLALDPSFDLSKIEAIAADRIREIAKSIRCTNLFRHSWIGLPGINFTKYIYLDDASRNLLDFSNLFNSDSKDESLNSSQKASNEQSGNISCFDIDERLKLLAPRYVHFHELNLLEVYKTVYNANSNDAETVKMFDNILDKAFYNYWVINQRWKYHESIDDSFFDEKIKNAKADYFEIISHSENENLTENCLSINIKNNCSDKHYDKVIGLANIKISSENIKKSYLGHPNTDRQRRQELFKLINTVTEHKCDLFILPEVSVPYQWVNLLAYQSYRRNIAIVAGLEHWVNKSKFAFNFMVTVLPIKKNDYTTCCIKIRLKNHYSHEEKKQLKGYRLLIPGESLPKKQKKYDLFHWGNIYFSVYNCFELADIFDRSLFKSKIDFIIASEYNKDTNYFAEIAGSWARDVHCFFIQVNSSDCGDSRVIRPSSSVMRDMIQIKGGENSTVVIGKIPISELRDFQLKEYELQKDDCRYKPTPPDFNRENVLKRMQNKKF